MNVQLLLALQVVVQVHLVTNLKDHRSQIELDDLLFLFKQYTNPTVPMIEMITAISSSIFTPRASAIYPQTKEERIELNV